MTSPGTQYPKVADRVAGITGWVRERSGASPTAYVDATGVGLPVVDLLRERLHSGRLVAVYCTYGDRRAEAVEEGQRRVSLGKAFLVSRLQALLQCGRLHPPRTGEHQVAGCVPTDLVNAGGS